ncbi:MAG: hypothetical protein HW377_2760 [Actinobacteria bacterium]|nr:hypothetical protein [Actinomycetota bacterium]
MITVGTITDYRDQIREFQRFVVQGGKQMV